MMPRTTLYDRQWTRSCQQTDRDCLKLVTRPSCEMSRSPVSISYQPSSVPFAVACQFIQQHSLVHSHTYFIHSFIPRIHSVSLQTVSLSFISPHWQHPMCQWHYDYYTYDYYSTATTTVIILPVLCDLHYHWHSCCALFTIYKCMWMWKLLNNKTVKQRVESN